MNKVVEIKAIPVRDLIRLAGEHTLSKSDLIDRAETQLLNLSTGWSRAKSTKTLNAGFPIDWDYTVIVYPNDEVMLLISYKEFKKLVLE